MLRRDVVLLARVGDQVVQLFVVDQLVARPSVKGEWRELSTTTLVPEDAET